MMFSYKQKLIISILFLLIIVLTIGLILPNYLNNEKDPTNPNPNNTPQNTTNTDWLNGLKGMDMGNMPSYDYNYKPYPPYPNGDFNNDYRSGERDNVDHNKDNKSELNKTDKKIEYPNPHIFQY